MPRRPVIDGAAGCVSVPGHLLLLMPASMVPFAAGMLGEHSEEPSALHVYDAVLIVLSLSLLLPDSHLARHLGLLWHAEDRRRWRSLV